eukprot:14102843-Ditylum_brightwellii.AAC.1
MCIRDSDGLVKQQWLDKVRVINDHAFPFLDMQMECTSSLSMLSPTTPSSMLGIPAATTQQSSKPSPWEYSQDWAS